MAVEINLLPDKKAEISPDVEAGLKKAKQAAVIILFVVFVVAAGTFAYGQAILAQKKSLEQKITNLEKIIASYKDREITLVLLKTKIAGINTVLKNRPDVSRELDFILSIIPPETEIIGFTADKNSQFTVNFKTRNSQILDGLLTSFKNSKYKNVVLGGLTGNASNGYQFKLAFDYE